MGEKAVARAMAVAGIALVAASSGFLLRGSIVVDTVHVGVSVKTEATRTTQVATSGDISATVQPTATGTAPTVTESATPSGTTAESSSSSETEAEEPGLPKIKPAPAKHLTIPAIDVDVDILPVNNYPTGKLNAWGGEIFTPIDFPVDQYARQWVRRGDPNSLSPKRSADDVKAFDRTFLYGHASDIGNHLIFQDLSALKPGDEVYVDTKRGRFTYEVTTVLTSQKVDLDNFAELYEFPAGGAKELALVACLPDTTSNVVALATLVDAVRL